MLLFKIYTAVGVNNKKIRREWSIDLCDVSKYIYELILLLLSFYHYKISVVLIVVNVCVHFFVLNVICINYMHVLVKDSVIAFVVVFCH